MIISCNAADTPWSQGILVILVGSCFLGINYALNTLLLFTEAVEVNKAQRLLV